MHKVLSATLVTPLVAGSAVLAGAIVHARSYALRQRSVVLPAQALPQHSARLSGQKLRILHLSDTHLMPYNRRLQEFLQSLAALKPDFVVITGDLIATDDAIEPLRQALAPLAGIPGAFVYGSNDYFGPRPKNPARYLLRNSTLNRDNPPPALNTKALTAVLESLGWTKLNNRSTVLELPQHHLSLELVGVNDPHIQADRFPEKLAFDPAQRSTNTLRIGLTHAPYAHVLNKFRDVGCDLAFAGHTHGGQVCLPGGRSLVTNCDLPPAFAAGLFTWPLADGEQLPRTEPLKLDGTLRLAAEQMAVQVSAGLGTSPFTPIRTFCSPEAIVLDVA